MNEDDQKAIFDSLPTEVNILAQFESLKDIERQNPLGQNPRRERVAEHSWHIAVGVVLLAGFCPDPIDIARAVLLATVHDVVEVFVGDTFAFGNEVVNQKDLEVNAMVELRRRYPEAAVQYLVDLWDEYEAQETSEARFVKGVDAFLPILLNFTNLENSSWLQHEVDAAKVYKRLARVEKSLGSLADLNKAMIAFALKEGYLK